MSHDTGDGRMGIFDFLNSVSIGRPKKPEFSLSSVSIGGPHESEVKRPPGTGAYDFGRGYHRNTPPPGVGIIPGIPPPPPFSSPPVGYRPPGGTHAPPPHMAPHNHLSQPPPPLVQTLVPPPHHPSIPHHAAPPPHMTRLPMPPNNNFQHPHPAPSLSRPPPPCGPGVVPAGFDYGRSTKTHHRRPPPRQAIPAGPPPLPHSRYQVPPPLPPEPPLSRNSGLSMPPPPVRSPPISPRSRSMSTLPFKVEKTRKHLAGKGFLDANNAKSRGLYSSAIENDYNESTPSPPPLPPSTSSRSPVPSPPTSDDDEEEEEPYDPENAIFSPASSSDSPTRDKLSEDSLIDKYVRQHHKLQSPEVFSKSLKTLEKRKRGDKKKKAHDSIDGSSSITTVKPEFESPARPNLESRLKSIFGRTEAAEEEKLHSKSKKSLSKALESDPDLENDEKPLKVTPSPFISRFMYLYWHNETIKAREQTPVISNVNFGDSDLQPKTTSTKIVKPQLNGQLPVGKAMPLAFIPPLPKNLPTVPPPNYKSTFAEPMSLKEGSLKAEHIFKNISRLHPYKVSDSKGHILKNSLDSELEITSEAMPVDASEENASDTQNLVIPNGPNEKTVHLVLTQILSELKDTIRQEITLEILDKKVDQCLEKDKKY